MCWMFCRLCVVSKHVHEEFIRVRKEFSQGYFDGGSLLIHIHMGIKSRSPCITERVIHRDSGDCPGQ